MLNKSVRKLQLSGPPTFNNLSPPNDNYSLWNRSLSNKQHQLKKTDICRGLTVSIEISSGHHVLSMKHYLHINLLLRVFVCVCMFWAELGWCINPNYGITHPVLMVINDMWFLGSTTFSKIGEHKSSQWQQPLTNGFSLPWLKWKLS